MKSLEGLFMSLLLKRSGPMHLKVLSKDLVGRLTTQERRTCRNGLFLTFDRSMGTVPTNLSSAFFVRKEASSIVQSEKSEG